jgi:WD40 repeat protein
MVQPFQAAIKRSPMQVYFSALAFEPSTSHIARGYHPFFAGSIPRVVLGTRNAQLQSLVLARHCDNVRSITFSPDGRRLASGSLDGTVRLWDPSTGATELVSETGEVQAVTLSSDGSYLSSASDYDMVEVWMPVLAQQSIH